MDCCHICCSSTTPRDGYLGDSDRVKMERPLGLASPADQPIRKLVVKSRNPSCVELSQEFQQDEGDDNFVRLIQMSHQRKGNRLEHVL